MRKVSYLRKLQKNDDLSLLVFEPTGCYSKELEMYCLKGNLPYHKVHLNKVYHFARSKGYAKTDKIDACILAQYAQQNNVSADTNNSIKQIERQELSSAVNDLKQQLSALKGKAQGIYISSTIKRMHHRRIRQLEKDLLLLQQELDEDIATDEDLKHKYNLLQTIAGVGKETARTLVIDLPELGQISRERISALVGVAPYNKDSGKKTGYRSIIGGRAHVRKVLYMAALVASRFNPRMKKIYQDLRMRGKQGKVALVAIIRKMLIMMNAMVKNNTPWSPEI